MKYFNALKVPLICTVAVFGALLLKIRNKDGNPPAQAEIKISSKRLNFFLLEPVWVDVTTKNIGKDVINHPSNWLRGYNPYRFHVYNSKNEELPLTDFGRRYMKMLDTPGRGLEDSEIPVDLNPGETRVDKFPVSKFVDLTCPGGWEGDNRTIYVQLERYGAKSNRLKLDFTAADFDYTNQYVRDDIKKDFPSIGKPGK